MKHGLEPEWQFANIYDACELDGSALHLWCLPLSLSAQQARLALSLLNDTQRDKYVRRTSKTLQETYLAGRFYLFELLASYLNCDPNNVLISYSSLNKPYLNPNPDKLCFNFTDTIIDGQGIGIYAICQHHSVGVDIESLNRKADFARIAKRKFNEAELKQVYRADGSLDEQACVAIWTRKEAFGKAMGTGINYTMRDTNLSSDKASPYQHNFRYFSQQEQQWQNWRLQQLQIDDTFVSSIVHASHTPLELTCFKAK